METKLMLLICLACQCSKHTASAQGCDQAHCSPVFNGKMCASHDLQNCCPAQCTFKQFGNARATYEISAITHISIGTSSTCSELFKPFPEEQYSRHEVEANPVGNTCPVKGSCDLYQCVNVIESDDNHVFVNEDYVMMVQTVTSSQSLSASFSTNSSGIQLTSTHFPVQGSLNAQQTNTHLFNLFPPLTDSVSHEQSMFADRSQTAIISKSDYKTVLPSQMPPPKVFNYNKEHYLYAMLGGVLAAGILCAVFIVLTIICLIFRCRRGAKSGDKSSNHRVEEPDNEYVAVSEREQHTSADSHHSEVLPINDYVQMSPQPIAPSLRQNLMSHGCGSPSWSFQPDTAGTFATCDTHSTHAFFASTTSMNKLDTAVRVTVNHPIASKHSTSSHHPFEAIDLDYEKGESSLEQSQEGVSKVPPKRLLRSKSPKRTMHVQEDLENASTVLNSSYNNVRVITASERIFQETNRAYLSNLSYEQVLELLDCLALDVYKPVFQQGRITGDVLVKFDERILEEGMGVRSPTDRTKFMKLIAGQYSAEELLFQDHVYEHDLY